MVSGSSTSSPWRHLAAGLLLLVCAWLMHVSERGVSPTADESLHLVRGHAYWWTESADLSIAHPPLANATTSLPFAFDGEQPRSAQDPEGPTKAEAMQASKHWAQRNPLPLSTEYFRHDFVQAKLELGVGRHVMMVWALLLAATMYFWADHRWGFTTGILALALTATFPTLLAHGGLVTTDIPATATTLWGLIALIAWVERPSWLRVLVFAPVVSAMVLVKHSGPLYVLVFAAILLFCAWRGAAGFATDARERRVRVATTVAQLSVAALVVGLAIAAAYRFDRIGMSVGELLAAPEPENWIAKRREGSVFEASFLRFLPDGLRLPFPYTWLLGVATVGEQNEIGHGRYFLGLIGRAWHPLYFPVMLIIKTPVGMLALLGLGGALGWRRRRTLSTASRVLLAFFAICLGLAIFSRINIGVRHALPLVPIMILFAARAGALAWELASSSGRDPDREDKLPGPLSPRLRARGFVVACLLANAGGAAWTYPHWLSDFNLLVGGPRGGHFISMIGEDWGQDVAELGEELRARGFTRVRYYTPFPLRRDELEAAGVEPRRLRCAPPESTTGREFEYIGPDPIVIHATDWLRRRDRCFPWMAEREPDLVVNHHVLVFLAADPAVDDSTQPEAEEPDEDEDDDG